MSKITGNEPAMPFIDFNEVGHGDTLTIRACSGNPNYIPFNRGLTIRQQFSAMAMQGCLSNSLGTDLGCEPLWHGTPEKIARYAVEMADALIAELNKTTNATK